MYFAKAGLLMRGENPRRFTGCGAPGDTLLASLPQAGQNFMLSDICVPHFGQYIAQSSCFTEMSFPR